VINAVLEVFIVPSSDLIHGRILLGAMTEKDSSLSSRHWVSIQIHNMHSPLRSNILHEPIVDEIQNYIQLFAQGEYPPYYN